MRDVCVANWPGMKRSFLASFLLLVSLTLTACSDYDTRFAKGVPGTAKGDRFSGTYAGRWTSTSHPGGEGKLWCILSRQGDAAYLAEFKATWHGVHMSEHSAVLHTKRASSGKGAAGRAQDFIGTAELKTLIGAGTYRCEGAMDGARLRACYDATYDRGTFELQRATNPPARR